MAAEEASALWQWAGNVENGRLQPTAEEVRVKARRCVELLADENAEVKRIAAMALGDIADSPHAEVGAAYAAVAPRVLEALMSCLGDGDTGVRRNAAWALGGIADSPHADLVTACAETIPSVFGMLGRLLLDSSDTVRNTAFEVLQTFAGHPSSAMRTACAAMFPGMLDYFTLHLNAGSNEQRLHAVQRALHLIAHGSSTVQMMSSDALSVVMAGLRDHVKSQLRRAKFEQRRRMMRLPLPAWG